MSDITTTVDSLVQEFAEQHLEKIFYFCLKKTGSGTEAEDLAGEIALHVIDALNRGNVPGQFAPWVWKITRNRYARWAESKRRKSESFLGEDISEYEIPDECEAPVDAMIRREQLALLRRELAFIRGDYRSILVAHYIEDRRVRDIAASMNLSEDTVKQRLCRARKILKEGMDMAREFGTKSYKPEEIRYSFNCREPGKKNQPYSLMEHALYQNILLEAYETPATAEALALELGIALPYMEEELAFLTRETLLSEQDGKYTTTFPIISGDAQEKVNKVHLETAAALTKELTAFVDRLNEAFKAVEYPYYGTWQDYESAKWTLLILAYNHFAYGVSDCCSRNPFTKRPEGGQWDITAYQKANVNHPGYVGNHGSDRGFQQMKYQYHGIEKRTPHFLTTEECNLLHDLAWGEAADTDSDTAKALLSYGYLKKEGETVVPDVLVLKYKEIRDQTEKLDPSVRAELQAMADKLSAKMQEICDRISAIIKADLPCRIAADEHLYKTAVESLYFESGYVFTEAIKSGWLLPEDLVSPVIGAHFRA